MATETCHPRRPVPVLHFHGTKDSLVSYGGPNEHVSKTLKFKSVEDSVLAWVRANECPERPVVVMVFPPIVRRF